MAADGVEMRGARELVQKLNKIGVKKSILALTLKAALHLEGVVREVIMRTFTKNPTGNLARSFKARLIRTTDDGVSAGVFSELIYAKIQDEGGTITPRTARNLAIPLNRAASKRWPREWGKGKLHFAKMRGKKFLVDKAGVPQYALRESVTIRGRGYLREAKKLGMPGVLQILGDGLRAKVK